MAVLIHFHSLYRLWLYPIGGIVMELFGRERLSKVVAEAGYVNEKLGKFGNEAVASYYSIAFNQAMDNLLASSIATAVIQFDFISKIELLGSESIEENKDSFFLLIQKKELAELKELAGGLNLTIKSIEKTIIEYNQSNFIDMKINLFSYQEALNELFVNNIYPVNFIVKYVNSIKLEIENIREKAMRYLKEEGNLEDYDRICNLVVA